MGVSQSMSVRARFGRKRILGVRLFFLVFLVVGAGLAWPLLLRPMRKMIDALQWEPHPCTIISGNIERSRDSDGGTIYGIAIHYRYRFGGREFESDSYGFADGVFSSGYKSKQAILDRCSETTCFVNPRNPAQAVLNRGWTTGLLIGLVPAVFLIIGIGGLIFGRTRTSPMPLPPISVSANPHPDGPLVLTSGSARLGAFIGLAFFALLWNGVVWGVFLGSKMPVFILVIFGSIGLFVVLLAVRQLLVLFNPRIVLAVGRRQLTPGERLQVDWTLQGDIRRVRRLRIFLEGKEKATYRRGTNDTTDTHVFAQLGIVDVADRFGNGEVSGSRGHDAHVYGAE